MTDPHTLRLIFTRAIRNKSDQGSVHVRPDQLVLAVGQATADRLAGQTIDLTAIASRSNERRQALFAKLDAERAELEQLASAGFGDSRRELKELLKRISKLKAGQLNVASLVSVPVGAFRMALQAAADSAGDAGTSAGEPGSDAESGVATETPNVESVDAS